MEQLHLEKLIWDNYNDVTKLKVNKEQKTFVAPNSDSLIDAYFATIEEGMKVFPFGIYLGKKPVGFIMIAYDVPWATLYYDIPSKYYYIWRFMIDKKYQGKGFGRQAFMLAINFVKTYPAGKADLCWVSYEPSNEKAKKLYSSCGFKEAPEYYVEGEEMPAILKLRDYDVSTMKI